MAEIKKLDETIILDEENLKQIFLREKSIIPRFKLPTTQKQAETIIRAAYRAEVQLRQRLFVNDYYLNENISAIAKSLTGDSTKYGLLLAGSYGNGKTTMTKAVMRTVDYLIANNHLDHSEKFMFVKAKDLAEKVKNADEEFVFSLKKCKNLCIDDMGRDAKEVLNFGNILTPMIDLLDYRYDNQKFTIITTNLDTPEVKKDYTERMYDRFKEMFEIITFENESYRK